MKKILLIMNQPPGCNGVQASMFSKLLPFLEDNGWQFHFAGPSPSRFSVLRENIDYPNERLHYTNNISASKRFAVQKNRCPKRSIGHIIFGCLQLTARTFERLTGHNSDRYLRAGLEKVVCEAEATWNYDLIASISPGFEILELGSRLAKEMAKPFFAIYTDPYGARQGDSFYPNQPELQTAILTQACGAFFTSPLTRQRYVDSGLVSDNKAYYFLESYPESVDLYAAGRSQLAPLTAGSRGTRPLQFVYLGILAEWRPVEPLLEAIKFISLQESVEPLMELTIFGFLYPSAKRLIKTDPTLSRLIHIDATLPYALSHWVAEDCDVQLVLIGPRHIDNLPSKFFDYLAHKKPVLVLGPPENPLRQIIDELRIGRYVDGGNMPEITQALLDIQANYSTYQDSYQIHREQLAAYGASKGAQWICQVLDQSLEILDEFTDS